MENGIVKNRIAEFKELFSKGMNCIAEACRIYVEDIDRNPEIKQEYRRQLPQIPNVMWMRFESVGRNMMIPELIYAGYATTVKLIGQCSIEEQKKIQKNGIDVLTVDGTSLKVKIENLTPQQERQVFTRTGIRDLAAQKAYIESLKTVEKIEQERTFLKNDPYIVRRDYVEILKAGKISREEILNIVREMMK